MLRRIFFPTLVPSILLIPASVMSYPVSSSSCSSSISCRNKYGEASIDIFFILSYENVSMAHNIRDKCFFCTTKKHDVRSWNIKLLIHTLEMRSYKTAYSIYRAERLCQSSLESWKTKWQKGTQINE